MRRRKLGRGFPVSSNVELEAKIEDKNFALSVEDNVTMVIYNIGDSRFASIHNLVERRKYFIYGGIQSFDVYKKGGSTKKFSDWR